MNAAQSIYCIEPHRGLTPSYEAVSKDAFRPHQTEKNLWSITRLALSILAITQSSRSHSLSSATALVAPTLGLQLLFDVPMILAQSTSAPTPVPGSQVVEFQINADTPYNPVNPSVAPIPGGGSIAVWKSYLQTENSYEIYGQLLDASGAKIGSEFNVSVNARISASSQASPIIAVLAEGRFIVAWVNTQIYGQLFNVTGTKIGSQFQMTAATGDAARPPGLAALGGGFIVAWIDNNSGLVKGQLFDNSSAKIGSEFQINTFVGNQKMVSAAALAEGGCIVVWRSYSSPSERIFGQRLDDSAAKVSGEFQINTNTARAQNPSVAAFRGGGFIVAWEGTDAAGSGIFGQIFNASNAKVGGEFQINPDIPATQDSPSVAALAGGGFIVTYVSIQGTTVGIYGRQFFDTSNANPGSEFQINNYTTPINQFPSAAALEGGGFIVSWSYRSGIFGQLFDANATKVLSPAITTQQTMLTTTSASTTPVMTVPASLTPKPPPTTSVSTIPVTTAPLLPTSSTPPPTTSATTIPVMTAPLTSTSSTPLLTTNQQTVLSTNFSSTVSSLKTDVSSSENHLDSSSSFTQSNLLLPTPTNPTPSSDNPTIPIIAGIASVLVALLGSIGGWLVFYMRRQKQAQQGNEQDIPLDSPGSSYQQIPPPPSNYMTHFNIQPPKDQPEEQSKEGHYMEIDDLDHEASYPKL